MKSDRGCSFSMETQRSDTILKTKEKGESERERENINKYNYKKNVLGKIHVLMYNIGI